MATKIKFDVSGSDPEKALAGNFEPPPPGVYPAKIESVKLGYKKGEDGKPDKEQPRLEIIYRITQVGKYKNAPLYDYIGFSEAQEWKMDQFLQAFGLATKSKRKGEFDPDKLANTPCRIRVKGDTNPSTNEYQAKPGAVMPPADDGSDDENEDLEKDELDLSLEDDPDPDLEPDPGPDLEDDAAPDPEPQLEGEWTEASLEEYTESNGLEALKKLATEEFEVDPLPRGKTKIISAILDAQEDAEPF